MAQSRPLMIVIAGPNGQETDRRPPLPDWVTDIYG